MDQPDPNGKMEEFPCDPNNFELTEKMIEAYERDGGFVVKEFLDQEEVDIVNRAVTDNENILKHNFGVSDGKTKESTLTLWNHPGDDVTGMVARCEKVVNTCEKLLGGGEIYHYHTKLMTKQPRTGGSHIWHQDYGYWYKNGLLKPDLMTVFIAIDANVIENGCLQILKGSHKFGRVDHKIYAGQQQIDLVRLEAIKKQSEWIYAQLEPGDAFFFHCNLIHTSDQNNSDLRRWAILCSYNRADNDPIFKHHHASYTPLEKVPNSAIKSCTNTTDMTGKDFVPPKRDATIKGNLTMAQT